MYFSDLTPYEYYLPSKLSNVLNIGWLDSAHEYPKSKASAVFVEKLTRILNAGDRFNARVNQIRGVHPCNLCSQRIFNNPFIGSCELWLPAKAGDVTYAAPSMIIHYIEDHDYCPPQEFVESVLQLSLDMDFNAQQLYDDLIRSSLSEQA
jgi:hypothetical protein